MTNTRKWIEQLDTSEMKKILEVPPQAKEIPQNVLKHANKADIRIREISGEALEQFKNMKFW